MARISAATMEDLAEPLGPWSRRSLFTWPERTKVPRAR